MKVLGRIQVIQLSDFLQTALHIDLKLSLNTAKARSENLISPLLKEVWRGNENKISYFSGYGFNVAIILGVFQFVIDGLKLA